jgi:hypothetical protein
MIVTTERELAAQYRGIAQSLAYTFPFVSAMIEGIAASYEREARSGRILMRR